MEVLDKKTNWQDSIKTKLHKSKIFKIIDDEGFYSYSTKNKISPEHYPCHKSQNQRGIL